MSITIGEHVFDGPYTTTKDLMNDPGVFAVIVAEGDRGILIDVGESNNVGECIEANKNKARWDTLASNGRLCFAVLYTPSFDQTERSSIEQGIRDQYGQNTQESNSSNTGREETR
jgi:hypothetical protein